MNSPIDTARFMRDMGRGYPEFDYAAAWLEVRPMWDALPQAMRDLFARVSAEARDVSQDKRCDLPWASPELQAAFAAADAGELAHAGSVVYALGHWLPGRAEGGAEHPNRQDWKTFGGRETAGAYWRFELYADQSIRERAGKPWKGAEPTPPSDLAVLCGKLGIKAEAEYGGNVPAGMPAGSHPYKVRLVFGKRRLTVPFFQGPAHEKEPTAADVLSCIVRDAQAGEQDFEDFASEMGYDPDSREAEKTWKACASMAPRVRRFLGDAFERVSAAEH